MHDIEMAVPSPEFVLCWKYAGGHLQAVGEGGVNWLKADPRPPFLEHLSFRLGNQLFFVRVEDIDSDVCGPGSLDGLRAVADGCGGYACVMPMRRRGTSWQPDAGGWGLLDALTGMPVHPPSLVTDEQIEITDWELHDFAVQIVRQHIQDNGGEVQSSCGNPGVDPSLWFVRNGAFQWVVVRAVRYPRTKAMPPANLQDIHSRCAVMGGRGYFAQVGVASLEQASAGAGVVVPLWRGHGYGVRFEGLQPVGGSTRA